MVRKNIGNWKKRFIPIITPESWSNHSERELFIKQMLGRRRFPKKELLEVLDNSYMIANREKRLEIIDTVGILFQNSGDPELPRDLLEFYKTTDDREVKKWILRILPKIGTDRLIPDIIALYRHPNKVFRQAAHHLLEHFDADQVVNCLADELTKGVWATRTEPLLFLNEVAPDKILDPCRHTLMTGSEEDRMTAIELLSELRTRDAMLLLADAIGDSVTDVRLAIASVVGRIPGDISVDILLELTEDHKSAVVVKALEGLRRLADERAIPRAVECVRHEDSLIRAQSLSTLGEIGSAEHVDLLIEGIKDTEIHIRQSALKALILLSRNEGIDITRLIVSLMADSDVNVRRAGAQLLGEVETPIVVGRILDYLQDPDWWVREMVANSLARVRDEKAFPAVVDLLKHPDASLRRYAIDILIGMGVKKAAPHIVSLLKDPDGWVRERAVYALGKLGSEEMIDILARLLDIPRLTRVAATAMGEIGHSRAIAPLLAHLEHADVESSLAILNSLERIRTDAATQDLEKYLHHPNRDIRNKTKEVLTRLKLDRHHPDKTADTRRGLQTISILDSMLLEMRRQGASNLFLVSDQPAIARLDTDLITISSEHLSEDHILSMIASILTREQDQRFHATGCLDFSHEIPTGGRFRGNLSRHAAGLNLVFRALPDQIPVLEDLDLPIPVNSLADCTEGLVLITGPEGSGKTTTIAALINRINETRGGHIITIEEPIEFIHTRKNCLITQREIGRHTTGFVRALRTAVLEDPDVIYISDLHDPDTIATALDIAEAGHFVLAVMDSISTTETIDQLIAAFPSSRHDMVRTLLSESLKAIVSQRLAPRLDGKGNTVATEILVNTPSIADLIRNNRLFQIPAVITSSNRHGMMSLDQSLIDRVREEIISNETAFARALDKNRFEQYLMELGEY
ncbi:PilT/PilU family type 4a pilus ATPase [bacterium]|nr:PilT/PilU family type 4a pilus ATPase [candidate division CSSED10-310 bacterium]